jgi:hypothetical protein
MIRPLIIGFATATLADELAKPPAVGRTQGGTSARQPEREPAGNIFDAATVIPSTDT